jgi:hypothetical protein
VSQVQGDGGVTITRDQGPLLMMIYGTGAAAVFATLAVLYGHAYRMRNALELSPLEVIDARIEMLRNVGIAAIATVSVAFAALGMVRTSGFLYFAIGLSEWTLGASRGRLRRRVAEAAAAEANTEGTSPA